MTRQKHLCVIHDNVDSTSSIGKLAMWAARTGLEAGWQVTVVALDLDRELANEVTWKKLYVPPRLHLLQWVAARWTIPRAMGDRSQYDVIHTFQAQVAALADVYHVQYLSAPARESGALETDRTPKAVIGALQKHAVTYLEERYLRRLPPTVTTIYCSELIRDEFRRRYAAPRQEFVIPNPTTATPALERPERDPGAAPVWGYLGGWDKRKGYEDLFAALRRSPRSRLVFAGPGEGSVPADLADRVEVVGHLNDLGPFFAKIDVLAVPSLFEPYGMVVGDAAAHGVPCVVTPNVGAAQLVERYRIGTTAGAQDLGESLELWSAHPHDLRVRTGRFLDATNEPVLGARLRAVFDGLSDEADTLGRRDRHDGPGYRLGR